MIVRPRACVQDTGAKMVAELLKPDPANVVVELDWTDSITHPDEHVEVWLAVQGRRTAWACRQSCHLVMTLISTRDGQAQAACQVRWCLAQTPTCLMTVV